MNRTIRNVLAAICTVVAIATLPASPASAHTVSPAYTSCYDGAEPNGFNPAGTSTPRSAAIFGRTIDLRYNTNRCAWGKISNGSPTDEVWVDRSYDGGTTWQGMLGDTTIQSGTDTHTLAYNDANVLMRACGKAGNRPNVVCTGWY